MLLRFLLFLILSFLITASLCKTKPPPQEEEFLEPVNVSNTPGASYHLAIAGDSKGTVHLVWCDETPGNEEIFYAYKPKGGLWSTPVDISNNPWCSRFPCIAVDKNDVIHLAWQNSSAGRWRIFYSRKAPESSWSIPETITGEWDYVVPKLAVDSIGNVHLAWSYGGYYSGIRYTMRTNDGFWLPQMTVAERALNCDPAIAVDNQGNVHLIWAKVKDDYTGVDILYSMKSGNGGWSSPEIIRSHPTGHDVSICVDNQENIICVWDDDTPPPEKPDAFYREKRADGTWTNPAPVCTSSYVMIYEPSLAKGPAGELYLAGARRHKEGGKCDLLYLTKPSGRNWSDTLICGVTREEPYTIWARALAVIMKVSYIL